MSQNARLTAIFGADASEFMRVCDQVEGRLDRMTRTSHSVNITMDGASVGQIEQASGAVAGLTSNVGDLVKTYVGVKLLGEAFDGLKDLVFGFNAMRETAFNGFETQLKGNEKAARDIMSQLQAFSIPTPFKMEDLAPLANQVLGFKLVLKETADVGQQVVGILNDAGDASFGLARGQEGVNRFILALGQMRVTGKATSQDLLQLTSLGVSAWDYLAEATGKSTAEVRKLVEKGLIPASVAIQAVRAGVERDFGGAMQHAAKTWDGAWSQIEDSLKAAIADGFLPFFQEASDEAQNFAQVVSTPEMTSWINDLASEAQYGLTLVVEVFKALVEAVQTGNPVLIGAITLLGGRLVWLGATAVIGTFLPAAQAIVSVVGTVGAALGELAIPVAIAVAAITALSVAYRNNFLNIQSMTGPLLDYIIDPFKAVAYSVAKVIEALSWSARQIPDFLPGAKALKGWLGNQDGLADGIAKQFDSVKQSLQSGALSIANYNPFKNVGTAMVNGIKGLLPDLDKIKAQAEAAAKAAQIKVPHIDMPHFDPSDAADQKKALTQAASDWNQYANAIESNADRQIKALDKLRGSLVGFVQDLESHLLDAGGNMSDFYKMVAQLQKALPIDQTALSIFDKSRTEAGDARAKASQYKQQANVFGGGTVREGSPISSVSGAKSLFEKFNVQSTVDQTCADVASKTVEALGIAINKSVGAGRLEANVKAAGWQRVDPKTAPLGSLVFEYSASARSRVHAMMGLGDGELASSSDHHVSYRPARGNERAYAPPSMALNQAATKLSQAASDLSKMPANFLPGKGVPSFPSPTQVTSQAAKQSPSLDAPPRTAHDVRDDSKRPQFKPWTKYDPASVVSIPKASEFNEWARKAAETLATNDTKQLLASLTAAQKQFPQLRAVGLSQYKTLLMDAASMVDMADVVKGTRDLQKESGEFVKGKSQEATALKVYNETLKATAGDTLVASRASQIAKFIDEQRSKMRLDQLQAEVDAEAKKARILAQQAALANAVSGPRTPQERDNLKALDQQAATSAKRATDLQNQATARQTELTHRVTAFSRELDNQFRSDAFGAHTGRVKDLTNQIDALNDETVQQIALRKAQQLVDAGWLSDSEKQAEVLKETNLELAKLDREHTLKIRGLSDSSAELHYALDLLAHGISGGAFDEATQTHADFMARYLELTRKGVDATKAYGLAWREAFEESQNRQLQNRINALKELNKVLDDGKESRALAEGHAGNAQAFAPDDPRKAREDALFEERRRLLKEMNDGHYRTFGEFGFDEKLADFTKTYDTQHAADQTTRLAEAFWELDKAQKSIRFAGSPIAGDKYDTTFGNAKDWTDEQKSKYLDDKLGTKRTENSASIIADLIGQQNDLEGQIAESVASRAGSLDALKKLELEWKVKDDEAFRQFGQRSQAEVGAIEARRNEVRGLMRDLIANQKVQDQVDAYQSLWVDAFGNVQSKGLKSFGDLFDGIMNQFQQMTLKIAADQIWNSLGLGGLFGKVAGSVLGGASSSSGLPSVVPFLGATGVASANTSALQSSRQTSALVASMMSANRLSALSTQAHIAAQTGSFSGRSTNSAPSAASMSVRIDTLHVHSPNPQQVPQALTGAILSHRQLARSARKTLGYGADDD